MASHVPLFFFFSAYHILHGATEMVRGALLGLGDTAGNALASKTHSNELGAGDTERDVSTPMKLILDTMD